MPKAKKQEDGEDKPTRDERVDRLGILNQLAKDVAEPLKREIKGDHGAPAELEGDFFTGKVIETQFTSVSESDWLKLYESKKIDREQFLRPITVSAEEPRKILDEQTFKRISKVGRGADQLRVFPKKDAELSLVEMVQKLQASVEPPARAAA